MFLAERDDSITHGFNAGSASRTVFERGVPLITQGIATVPGQGTFAVATTTEVSGPVPITVPFGSLQALALDSRLSIEGIGSTKRAPEIQIARACTIESASRMPTLLTDSRSGVRWCSLEGAT